MEITKLILEKLEKPESLIQHVDDRLGHDRRYSLDATKTRKLGCIPNRNLKMQWKKQFCGIKKTHKEYTRQFKHYKYLI